MGPQICHSHDVFGQSSGFIRGYDSDGAEGFNNVEFFDVDIFLAETAGDDG